MIDGSYQVRTRTICAAFVVENGIVIRCDPIIRAMWRTGRLKREHIVRSGNV